MRKQHEKNAHIKKSKRCWQWNDIKENIFVARKGGKQQKAAVWPKINIATFDLGFDNLALSYKSICNKWLIPGACINTQLEVVFSDNNKRIINVELITFRSFQWLMTKWWRIVGDCCFEIEITFKMTCHLHCYITLKRIYIISSHHMFNLFVFSFKSTIKRDSMAKTKHCNPLLESDMIKAN